MSTSESTIENVETVTGGDEGRLLRVEGVHTWMAGNSDPVRAVDGVSFTLQRGEALGIVGESGSGKSVLARTVMGLLPPAAVVSGSVVFDGVEMTRASGRQLQSIWGARIAMVFQDAGRALNPVVRIGRQMCEPMVKHLGIATDEARKRAITLLDEVGVSDPARRMSAYPHQLSGGMRQRVMIAMALACEPDLLIADEPTTALDITVQRQILDLLDRVRRQHNMALILISHDLGMVSGRTDRVMVMYAGRTVETGTTAEIFRAPEHRYTAALLGSTPSLDGPRTKRLLAIEGQLPDPRKPPEGCRFRPRCTATTSGCEVLGKDALFSGPTPTHTHTCLHPVRSNEVISV
ncbi:ABC transporter ATP-binding protein [Nocardia jinanensis]|uniref:ABC transporter ATP-binding protein n=1 Tax=Nocardia jinanensis TaxID=382504 RepID=A0A917VTE5_9NOCA|nr:ABC transporter ATP-binding protein [Nocardia jinanensis]GGL12362.1 ABC transporter ATP-binding protein [Nocardia jinanensis]